MKGSLYNYIGQLNPTENPETKSMPRNIKQFTRGSVFSNEDPLYLTFYMDFDESCGDTSHLGGLAFNSLLQHMSSWDKNDVPQIDLSKSPVNLEISAKEYLQRQDNSLISDQMPNAGAAHLVEFHKILNDTYLNAPWYFQSISGVSELWKKATDVKGASKKATLTITCNESVDMRILQMADRYRKAIYDTDAMAYRVPDNIRNFAFDLYLFEIRNLRSMDNRVKEYNKEFSTDPSLFTAGIHYMKFKCKMCEFDFSDTLAGGITPIEVKSYIEDKPFAPSFKINVGWVKEESSYVKVDLINKNFAPRSGRPGPENNNFGLGIFQGAADSLASQANRLVRNLAAVPARVIGSVLTELQGAVTNEVLGNVYDRRDPLSGLNSAISGLTDEIGQVYTPESRVTPIGPPTPNNLGKAGGY